VCLMFLCMHMHVFGFFMSVSVCFYMFFFFCVVFVCASVESLYKCVFPFAVYRFRTTYPH
jgi:hypothetical protein